MRHRTPVPGRTSASGDEGMALVAVLGVMAILTLFLLSTLAFTIANVRPTKRDQDGKSAVAAAQAGIDDYISRLNGNADYWTFGADPVNCAFPTSPAPCTGQGRTVPGSNGASATYKYSLLTDAGTVASKGVIRLKATGTSKGISRTLTADLSPSGFLQFIYHTDLEDLDPVLYTTNASTIANCSKYWYAGRSSASGCSEITFPGSDVISGPLHSNDAMSVGNSTPAVTFANRRVETSWNDPPTPWRGSATPRGFLPKYAAVVAIPASNSELKVSAAGADGCFYTGATKITFNGNKMNVLSPNSVAATTPTRCWNSSASDKGATQNNLAIPSVIYVDDKSGACQTKPVIGTNLLGYPLAGEYVGAGSNAGTSVWDDDYKGPVYNCANGTAYVGGTVDGAVTVSSTQDVVVVSDLRYADESASSTDVVGLIPGHFMWVYHPIKTCGSGDGYCNLLGTPVTKIDGAILAVKDSFIVQNFDMAPAISTATTNRLSVTGAIAQKFRGRVAGSGIAGGGVDSGYVKNYVYDDRFLHGVQPPYFLKPVSAQWDVLRIGDG